ncbi:MAG: hypothetical protein ACXVJK_09770, partial [Candidatus Aminicenantales bacterium]
MTKPRPRPTRPAKAFLAVVGIIAGGLTLISDPQQNVPEPRIPFSPERYVIQRSAGPIQVDGRLNEESWMKAGWTEVFGDI